MNDMFYKRIIEESRIGYAYHKIVCDKDGIPCDYEFIEVNAAFEKLTGLKGSDIVGRKITEILSNIKKSEFDWIHFYGDIAINGGKKEFEQFSELMNKWYKVEVYSPEKNYFLTHFIDVSKEMSQLSEVENMNLQGKDCRIFAMEPCDIKCGLFESKEAEAELIEVKEYFDRMFNTCPDAALITRLSDGLIFNVNEGFITLTGLTRDGVIGKNILELNLYKNPNDRQRIVKELGKKGYFKNEEVVFQQKDGRVIIGLMSAKIIMRHNAEYVFSCTRDITECKQAERETKNTMSFLQVLMDAVPTPIFYKNAECVYIGGNKAFERYLGLSSEQFVGKTVYDISPMELAEKYDKADRELLNNLGVQNYEASVVYADGTLHEVVFNKATFTNTEGKVAGLIGVILDITERKKAEYALKESEEKYRLLITQMNQGLAVHEVILNEAGKVVDYRFLDTNDSFERLTGLIRENTIGKTILEILPDTESCWIEKYAHVAMTGEPLQYENYSQELDKYLEIVVYSPRYKQFAVIISDITERKRLETAFAQEKKLLETTLSSVGDGVISTDNKGKIVFLNRVAEFLTGWTQEEARGKSIEEVFNIVNEFTRGKSENIVKKVLDGEQILEMPNHTILISKDGIERPIEDSAAPIVQENGEIVGVVVVLRDFSEKKQKLEKIEFLSYHDQLTGLYNRRFYEEELMRLDTKRNLPMTIVMSDVNGLKLINDSFGHAMGDELLQKVAEVITKGCRGDDIIARLGGDEFVILLPKTDAFEAREIIKRIKGLALKEKVGAINISISFGYETKKNEGENVQEVFKKAEDYMYRHKLFESPSMRGKTIGAIITTLHEKNKREEEHSHRVSSLCKSMGRAIGLPESEIEELKTVGFLHDIGKIVIEENILNKPGELTGEEWKEIKRHPEIGYRILNTVNDMSGIANYVLYHHERWDGKGYPKGLKGDEIPFVSRIITIADAYDAMTSERSYRSALSDEVVIAELQKNAGIQFDPELLFVFIEKVLNRS